MTGQDRVMLDLTFHKDTPGDAGALLLSRDADTRPEWVPKSLCKRTADGKYAIERFKAEQLGFLIVRDARQPRLL